MIRSVFTTMQTSVVPNLEIRRSHLAADAMSSDLEKAGSSMRAAVSVKRSLSRTFGVVGYGSYLSGSIEESTSVGMSGFRAALHLEWTP